MTRKTRREVIYRVLDEERDYQDAHTLHDDPGNPGFSTGDYITMMRNYVDRLAPAWALNPGTAPQEVLCNMRKIAAIAVQCMEVHGYVTREEEGQGDWGARSDEERGKE